MKKRALITGIAGQDGSYLAEFLLKKGYEVYGMIPRRSTPETQTLRINHIGKDLKLEYGDVTDMVSIIRIFKIARPHEVYHLAAQSHVQISFTEPINTTNVNAIGTLNMLEATALFAPKARFYNASSSEMFGNEPELPINEHSPMVPVSPYAVSKLYAYDMTKIYRKSRGLFASNGILFNHESPRRGLNFVTAKVVKGALDIKYGKAKELTIGHLDTTRDWGHAKDYVKAMWMMLQHKKADDFVVATGRELSVAYLCQYVFSKIGLGDYKKYVKTSKKYMRPYELEHLRGNPAKIKRVLKWKPEYTFEKMIDEMIVDLEKRFYPKNQ